MYSYKLSSRCLGLLVRKFVTPRMFVVKRLKVTTDTNEQNVGTNNRLEKAEQKFLVDGRRDICLKDQQRLDALKQSIREEQKGSELYPGNTVKPDLENDIVNFFYKLVDFDSFDPVPEADYETTALIQKKRTGKTLPRPLDGLSPTKLDLYIKQVNEANFNANRKLSKAISNIYRTIIESQTLVSIKSFNIIIRFFAVEYNFAMVRTILFQMMSKGINPDVNTFNCILSVIKSMKSQYKHDLFKIYLNQMNIFGIIPDRTTWYIMFNFLEEKKVQFYEKMHELKIPMRPICFEYLRFLHKYKGIAVDELLNLLEKKQICVDKHLLTILVQLSLDDSNPQKAFELLDKFTYPNGHIERVDFNSLISMVKYFAVDKKQPYFAIATINYFRSHYRLTLKIYRCYVELAKSMLKCSFFKNWSVLTRIYYKESMLGFGQSLISKKDIRALKNCAKNHRIDDFNITKLRKDEYAEAIFNFGMLQWEQKPILKLEDNESQFIEAAKYMIPHEEKSSDSFHEDDP